jgi:hypothetical protein
LRDAGQLAQQRVQLGVTFENDRRAQLRHHRHVARELDRVAEPLLRVHQDGLPRDVGIQPARLSKRPLVLRKEPPAPLVLRPTFFELPH